jgi:hypothetical protein
MLPRIERAPLEDLVYVALDKDQRSNRLNYLTLKIKKVPINKTTNVTWYRMSPARGSCLCCS